MVIMQISIGHFPHTVDIPLHNIVEFYRFWEIQDEINEKLFEKAKKDLAKSFESC